MGDLRKPDYQIYDDGTKVQDSVKSAVIQITVDERLNQASVCTIELRDDQGVLSDGSKFKMGADLKVELGYVGDTKVLFEGEVTGWKGAFPRRGPSTLTVQALDRLHRMRRERKQRAFLKMKDSEIVQQIVGDYGFSCDAKATTIKHDYIVQANECDADFVLERARLLGYEVFVEGAKKLVFRPPDVSGSAVVKLKWHETLERFSPTISTARVPSSVTATSYDMKQKKAVTRTAKKGDELSSMGGTKVAAEIATAVSDKERHVPWMPLLAPEEIEALAKGLFQDASLRLVTGEGAAQGHTAIRRGKLIQVDAIGDFLSGDYYVESALHTLLPAHGYTTTFRVKRAAVSKPPAPPAPKPAPAQKQPSPEPAKQDVSFHVKDDTGAPLEGLPYLLLKPDGTSRSGKLPADGKVEEKNVPAGVYLLELESASNPSVPEKIVCGKPATFAVDVTGIPVGSTVTFEVHDPMSLGGDPVTTFTAQTTKEDPHRAKTDWTFDYAANADKIHGGSVVIVAKAGETAVSMSRPVPLVETFEKTIKDKDGKPVANTKVLLRAQRGVDIETVTDDQGKVSLEVPPGDYRVEVDV